MKYFRSKVLGSLLLLSVLMLGCNSLGSNGDRPPELPPAESMQVSVSDMENASASKTKTNAESNFRTALFAAGVAKTVIEVNLAIPRILLQAAKDIEPQQNANGTWQWSYSVDAQDKSFEVLLTADQDGNGNTMWNFYVSTDAVSPAIENKLFFTGSTNNSTNTGNWVYFDLTTGEEVSEVSWDLSEGDKSVILEVVSDRNGHMGDSITYEFNGTVKSLVYLDASSSETTVISFNTKNHTGYIISPNYNDGVKACWDENLNNVTCS